ncbi:SapC family protein [Luteimonas sp. M1R5S18]|uniref:SapC family protein n=1 Tax=Luteimonas rhizosphaericola TaxID=3042024 RepID=A0ABT6JM33_9GAMM|nr:SapC family protein [Luteimonas rhizosphaericola]MDH5831066.1 SapC family protein [Luteimonas rhizosphaericola]
MARYELLDNVAHKDLRVVTRFGAGNDDPAGLVPAFPTEFAELQREYPIFLRKEADGGFHAVALLGFDADENLYLDGERWNAGYLPGAIARGPFLIGFQEQMQDGTLTREPVIHVDLDHPRVSRDGQGVAVFLPKGGHSPYLEHVTTVLKGIHDGTEAGRAMYASLDALGLIQPVELDLKFDDVHGARLTGLHGIDRECLAGLDAGQLHGLHRSGLLEGVYLMLSSLYNVRRLIAEKQRRLRAQAEAERAG